MPKRPVMSGFTPGGKFAPGVQQQIVRLLQQQQAMQPQHDVQAFPKSQQDFLNSLSAQQLQTLLNQKNSSVQQPMPTTQFPQSMMMQPQQAQPAPMASMPNAMNAANMVRPPAQNNMSAMLADMASKAKAGMLTPNQLVQLRAIIEQQQSVQQPQAQPNVVPNAQYAALLQSMQQQTMQQQPVQQQPVQQQPSMMMQTPASTSVPQPQMNAIPTQDNMAQAKQEPNMAQGVQFVRTIQQRIREVEQKLATAIPDNERQALQRAHQELTRVQTALVQKLAQQRNNVQQQVNSPQMGMVQPQVQQNVPNFGANYGAQAKNPMMNMHNQNQMGTSSPSLSAQSFNQSMGVQQPVQNASNPPVMTPSPEQFKRALTDLMNHHGKSFHSNPVVDGREVDLYHLFTVVQALGGSKMVTQKGTWPTVAVTLGLAMAKSPQAAMAAQKIAQVYRSFLELFEEVWNRAMLHQMSMSNVKRDNQIPSTSMPGRNDHNPLIPPNLQGAAMQNTTPRPNFMVQGQPFAQVQQRPAQPMNSATRQDLPITAEQLAQLKLKPEQLAQLLQQHKQQQQQQQQQQPRPVQNATAMPVQAQSNAGQNWPAIQQMAAQQAQARPSQMTPKAPTASPEKNQQTRTKVTPKMLEDAETVLKRVDASLASSRPKLPIIENMSETERSQVLEQIKKLVSLKATVVALLPAFLAMTGNIEPAKRVKIMIYMFDDQLALVPKRQCILRLTDLEKLKTQMTRCIGFVRVNDDNLAQQIVAKASQAMAQAQKAMRAKQAQEETAKRSLNVESPLNKRAKLGDLNEDFEITGTSSPKSTENAKSGTKTKSSKGKQADTPSAPLNEMPEVDSKKTVTPMTRTESPMVTTSPDHLAEALKRTQEEFDQEQAQCTELSKNSPIEFVKKTWNELIAMDEHTSKSKSMENQASPKGSLVDEYSVFSSGNTEAAVFALINAPYGIAGDFQDMLDLGVKDVQGLYEPSQDALSSVQNDDNPNENWDVQFLDFTSYDGKKDSDQSSFLSREDTSTRHAGRDGDWWSDSALLSTK